MRVRVRELRAPPTPRPRTRRRANLATPPDPSSEPRVPTLTRKAGLGHQRPDCERSSRQSVQGCSLRSNSCLNYRNTLVGRPCLVTSDPAAQRQEIANGSKLHSHPQAHQAPLRAGCRSTLLGRLLRSAGGEPSAMYGSSLPPVARCHGLTRAAADQPIIRRHHEKADRSRESSEIHAVLGAESQKAGPSCPEPKR